MGDIISDIDLFNSQNLLANNEMIIIKFTAEWCVPCIGIKKLVEELVLKLPPSIKYYEIDIDESIELYGKLKKMRMLNGIPSILGYKGGVKETWYAPDDSVLGADKPHIGAFFNRCIEYGK
jgi:thiol-disulfide isomerase/thioredoxin